LINNERELISKEIPFCKSFIEMLIANIKEFNSDKIIDFIIEENLRNIFKYKKLCI